MSSVSTSYRVMEITDVPRRGFPQKLSFTHRDLHKNIDLNIESDINQNLENNIGHNLKQNIIRKLRVLAVKIFSTNFSMQLSNLNKFV